MYLAELKALQTSKAWERYYFLSSNQPGYESSILGPTLHLKFSDMQIYNMGGDSILILRQGNDCYLSISAVTAVDCEPHVLGDILMVECADGRNYVIIAQ